MITALVGIGVGIASAILTETLLRTRERRFRIEDAVLDLTRELPLYQARFVQEIDRLPYDSGFGETWAQEQRVTRLLFLVRALARFPLRRYRRIRQEIAHILAQTMALEARASEGRWLRPIELLDLAMDRLFHLTFGRREMIDGLLDRYTRDLRRDERD